MSVKRVDDRELESLVSSRVERRVSESEERHCVAVEVELSVA